MYITIPMGNFLPPQMIITDLRKAGYEVKHLEYDDREYVFFYQVITQQENKYRTLTFKLEANGLLLM